MDQLTLSMAAIGAPALGGAWFSHRFAWWRPTVSYRRPRILMYHMVRPHRPGTRFNGLRVEPAAFEAQLRRLREQGWTFLTMTQATSRWNDLPEKSVVLTFDDGFEDNYSYALPLLRKYEAKATLYLVRDRFEQDWSSRKKAHHTGNELGDEPKLSDAQVRDMLASGLIELGSHTLSHPNFRQLTPDDKRRELRDSKLSLENTFQVPVTSFAYPFGIYSAGDEQLVRECGYDSAVTTDPGIDDTDTPRWHLLKRIKVGGKESPAAFRLRLRTGKRAWNK